MKKCLGLATLFLVRFMTAMESTESERLVKQQRTSTEYTQNLSNEGKISQETISIDTNQNPKSLVDLSKFKIAQILTSLSSDSKELNFSTNLLKKISLFQGLYKDMAYQALIEQNWPLLIASYKPYDNYKILEGHNGPVKSVAISPGSEFVLTGSEDKTAILWDTKKFEKVQVLEGHTDSVTSVSFSPDGKYIVTGALDKTLIHWKWNGKNFEQVVVIEFDAAVTSLAYSPSGKFILIGLFGGIAILLNIKTREEVELNLDDGNDYPISVAFSPNGKYALINSWKQYVLWDIVNLKEVITLEGLNTSPTVFSPNGKDILTGSSETIAILRDIKLAKTGELNGHCACINAVTFNADGKYALTGSIDKTAILWNIKSLEKIAVFQGHTESINCVAFSPDNKFALTGSDDNTAIAWNLELPAVSLETLVDSIKKNNQNVKTN